MSELLSTGVLIGEICDIVSVSRSTGWRMLTKLDAGESLERKPGNGESNRRTSDEFMSDLNSKIEERPTNCTRTLAKYMGVARGLSGGPLMALGLSATSGGGGNYSPLPARCVGFREARNYSRD